MSQPVRQNCYTPVLIPRVGRQVFWLFDEELPVDALGTKAGIFITYRKTMVLVYLVFSQRQYNQHSLEVVIFGTSPDHVVLKKMHP